MKTLCLIVPVLNEEKVLRNSIHTLVNEMLPHLREHAVETRIVIALNGSNQATQDAADACVSDYPDCVSVRRIEEKGRGRAIQYVCSQEEADLFAYIDVDLPIPLNEFWNIVQPVIEGGADIALGKRAGKRPLLRRIMTRGFRLLNTVTCGVSVQDAQCGVKVWTREVARTHVAQCQESGFFFDTELLARILKDGKRVTEIPIEWIDTRFAERKSSVRPVRDSLRALRASFRILRRTQGSWFYILTAIVVLLLCTCAQYGYMYATLQPQHFRVAHHFIEFVAPLFSSICGVVALYLAFGVVVLFAPLSANRSRALILVSVIGMMSIMLALLAIHPTRSQDVYWNLLLSRGQTHYGMNPYVTTPDMLPVDSWSLPVRDWRWLPMTHGPLWVLMLDLVTYLTNTLQVALVLLRIFFILALLLTFWAAYRILEQVCADPIRRARIFVLLILNPLWFQMGIIDLHNDVFIACAMTLACYALMQKKYRLSFFVLILGGLIKYTPWILLPVPLYYAWRERDSIMSYVKQYIPLFVQSALCIGVLYVVSGAFMSAQAGLQNEIIDRGTQQYAMFGTFLLNFLFPHSLNIAKGVAYVMALIILVIMTLKRRTLHAFTLPFVTILLFGTSWFQVWYVLWTLPLLIPLMPIPLTILLTALLLPMPELFFPSSFILLFSFAFFFYGVWIFLKKYIMRPLWA